MKRNDVIIRHTQAIRRCISGIEACIHDKGPESVIYAALDCIRTNEVNIRSALIMREDEDEMVQGGPEKR